MSTSSKHNHTTFTKSSPASLSDCIENILSHSSGKCHDSLTMATRVSPSQLATLSFTKSAAQHLFTNISLTTA